MPDCVKCLPVFAVRTGGVPVDVLEKLRSKRLIEKRQEISRAWNRLERAANHVIDMLYDAIGAESDSKRRVKILELRRQLLDRAKIYKFTTDRIGNLLSLEYQKEVHALIEIAMQHRELLHEYEELYAGEMHRIRLDFKKAITNANYLHGVLFASPSLYSNTDKYLKSDNNTDPQRADRLVEFSHLSYLVRAAVKTSPFATFTPVTLGKIVDTPGFNFKKDFQVAKSLVLDRRTMQDILAALKIRPEIRNRLSVFLNPTLVRNENHLSFYHEQIVRDGEGNQARNQTTYTWDIPSNPTLDLVTRIVSQNNPSMGELVSQLVQITNAEEKRVSAYIEDLLRQGVLEIHFPFSELTHTILDELIRFLSIFTEPEIRSLLELLTEVKKNMSLIEQQNPGYSDLSALHEAAKNTVSGIRDRLGINAKRKQYFYEDSCLPHLDCSMPAFLLDEIKEDLSLLNKVGTCCYHSQVFKLLNMQYVFKNYFSGAKKVDIITFFNRYFEILNARLIELDNDREKMSNPFNIREFDILGEYQKNLLDTFRDTFSDEKKVLHVKKERLTGLIKNPPEFVDFSTYFSAYLQKEAGDRSPWVLNEMRSGYYRYMSRFVYLTSRYRNDFVSNDAEAFKLLHEFEHTDNETIIAELGFIFANNNNVHKPLTKYRIRFPGCYCEKSDRIIELRDLKISLDSKGRPYLFSSSLGKHVIPIHIGLTNTLYAPAFYQFLLNFGPPSPFVPTPHAIMRPRWDGVDKIIPRIFVGKLMFARQRWMIRKDTIPVKKSHQTEADFFYRLNAWREARGLPSRVFLLHIPLWQVDNVKLEGDEQALKTGKKIKPRFLDFENPLTMKYFNKIIGEFASGPFVMFEECYPDFSNLMLTGEKSYVSEFLFEFAGSEEQDAFKAVSL